MKSKMATVNRTFPRSAFNQGDELYEIGEKVTVLRTYWYNGEGWATIRRPSGTVAELPDVFLDGLY